MSTTAGLGTQEYVAINPVAVVAALLGLASVLALLDNILLVVPLAAIICSLVALRQIQNSNGTQTGKALVALGLLLSIGLAGFIGSRAATAAFRTKADREAIGALVANFEAKLKAGDFEGAYNLFGPQFQERVSKQTFVDRWTYVRDAAPYGSISSIQWNKQAQFETDSQGAKMGYSIVILTFSKTPEPSRQEALFLKMPDGKWEFADLPGVFPKAPAASTPGSGK